MLFSIYTSILLSVWTVRTDGQTDRWRTDRQTTDKQTDDGQTGRQTTDRQTDRQTTDRQTDDGQTDRQTTDRQMDVGKHHIFGRWAGRAITFSVFFLKQQHIMFGVYVKSKILLVSSLTTLMPRELSIGVIHFLSGWRKRRPEPCLSFVIFSFVLHMLVVCSNRCIGFYVVTWLWLYLVSLAPAAKWVVRDAGIYTSRQVSG